MLFFYIYFNSCSALFKAASKSIAFNLFWLIPGTRTNLAGEALNTASALPKQLNKVRPKPGPMLLINVSATWCNCDILR